MCKFQLFPLMMLLNWLQSIANKLGFKTLKLKMGKNLNANIEVLQAICVAHLDCLFILDANEGYTPKEAIDVLEKLHGKGCFKEYYQKGKKKCFPNIMHLWCLPTLDN